jgi:arylsulfatase A-like enzyme
MDFRISSSRFVLQAALLLIGIDAMAAPVSLVNAGFELPINPSSKGEFGSGFTSSLNGWTIIAGDNANTLSAPNQISVGYLNLSPDEGKQALCLRSGAAVAQVTSLRWSDLKIGEVLQLTVSVGDRVVNLPEGMPYWSDQSFFGLSRGLATRAAAPGSVALDSGWIGKVAVASDPIDVPPEGFKSGTMGEMMIEHVVTAEDVASTEFVGVFLASIGTRLNSTTGIDGTSGQTNFSHNQSFWDAVKLEVVDAVPPPEPPPEPPPDSAHRPNIIFILADDFGWTGLRAVGAGPNIINGVNHGSDYYQTPNLARLAAQGLSFTHCYVQQNCQPTRAALISGQHPARSGNGVYNVSGLNRGDGTPSLVAPTQNIHVPVSTLTYAEVLQSAGYRTLYFGKTHVGDPLGQGYQQATAADAGASSNYAAGGSFTNNMQTGLNAWSANFTASYIDSVLKGPSAHPLHQRAAVPNNPDLILGNPLHGNNKTLTEAITDAVVDTISSHVSGAESGKPFLVQLHYYAVHTPIEPRYDLREKYRALPPGSRHTVADYAAFTEGLDQAIGRILDCLADPDADGDPADSIAEDTLVVFTSDNGGHRGDTDNRPLRHRKGSIYDGGIRVPLIVSRPGIVPQGTQSDSLVHVVDFYPTLLEHAGVAKPTGTVLDGFSFDAHMRDPVAVPRERPPVFYHLPSYLDIRHRPASLAIHRVGGDVYKLIYSYDRQYVGNSLESDGLKVLQQPWELYNLTRDISETRNLVDGTHSNQLLYGGIADDLAASLNAWLGQSTAGWNAKKLTSRSSGEEVPYPASDVPDVIVPLHQTFRATEAKEQAGGGVRITWNSESGFSYDIEGSSDLQSWQTLAAGVAAAGNSTSHEVQDPSRVNSSRRFYRVKLRK